MTLTLRENIKIEDVYGVGIDPKVWYVVERKNDNEAEDDIAFDAKTHRLPAAITASTQYQDSYEERSNDKIDARKDRRWRWNLCPIFSTPYNRKRSH